MIRKLFEVQKGEFEISTSPERLQLDRILGFIARSYWAKDRPPKITSRAIENSLCFGIYEGENQVGFARVISDYSTYAWLCDVFIDENYRGRGLGKWLIASIMSHPELQRVRRWALATRDAHEMYKRFGFDKIKTLEMLMEYIQPYPDLTTYVKPKESEDGE
jgi:GNAT superfamily N-acetyltransferase